MEIIDEITKLMESQTENSGYMRRAEIARALHLSDKTTLKYLQILKEQGRLEVMQISIRSVDDKPATVPAYRIKPE